VKWFAGSDHAGLQLKLALIAKLKELGDEVVDVGTYDEKSVDYPDFGAEVGKRVVAEPQPGAMGLVTCGSGIGISIAANKIHGVRCALVHDSYTAEVARQHNDANVVAMGGRVVGGGVAEAALVVFRSTAFLGDRHARRVDKLNKL
jgi:ribose 5-phosphate isomerase B